MAKQLRSLALSSLAYCFTMLIKCTLNPHSTFGLVNGGPLVFIKTGAFVFYECIWPNVVIQSMAIPKSIPAATITFTMYDLLSMLIFELLVSIRIKFLL